MERSNFVGVKFLYLPWGCTLKRGASGTTYTAAVTLSDCADALNKDMYSLPKMT